MVEIIFGGQNLIREPVLRMLPLLPERKRNFKSIELSVGTVQLEKFFLTTLGELEPWESKSSKKKSMLFYSRDL